MKHYLLIPHEIYIDLKNHLMQPDAPTEECAFLLVQAREQQDSIYYHINDYRLMKRHDFSRQKSDFLELTDTTKKELIKWAHDRESSLLEMHSHLGPFPAAFSYADVMGFQETVPHMWWRLQGRPYIAIVVSQSGYDALVWSKDPKIPEPLQSICVGESIYKPTNITFRKLL